MNSEGYQPKGKSLDKNNQPHGGSGVSPAQRLRLKILSGYIDTDKEKTCLEKEFHDYTKNIGKQDIYSITPSALSPDKDTAASSIPIITWEEDVGKD